MPGARPSTPSIATAGAEPEGPDSEVPEGVVRYTAAERRSQILDVAGELIVTEPPSSVTMDLVAERAGVSRPLVYKHFASRDVLLVELYRREARRLHSALVGEVEAAGDIEGMFRALVTGALRAADERGHLLGRLRAIGAGVAEVQREQRRRDSRTARAFTAQAVAELGIDPERGAITVALLLSLIDSVLAQWRIAPSPALADRLIEAYMAIVTSSLRALAPN